MPLLHRYISALASARVRLDLHEVSALLAALEADLAAPSPAVHSAAAAALGAFSQAYLLPSPTAGHSAEAQPTAQVAVSEPGEARLSPAAAAGPQAADVPQSNASQGRQLVERCLADLDPPGSAGPVAVRARCAALGALPAPLLAPAAPRILAAVAAAACLQVSWPPVVRRCLLGWLLRIISADALRLPVWLRW